jgi:hypothetical protein
MAVRSRMLFWRFLVGMVLFWMLLHFYFIFLLTFSENKSPFWEQWFCVLDPKLNMLKFYFNCQIFVWVRRCVFCKHVWRYCIWTGGPVADSVFVQLRRNYYSHSHIGPRTNHRINHNTQKGGSGSVVGWGSMLQAGRSRALVPMRWIFSIYLFFPAALWLWGRLNL